MATLSDMAFDYSLKRGTGKKAQENFFAGASTQAVANFSLFKEEI